MPDNSFRCTVCGYVHQGSSAPDHCPVCGVDASFFEPSRARSSEPVSRSSAAPLTGAGAGWRCAVCGHTESGDRAPDLCPVCLAGSEFFYSLGPPVASSAPPRDGQKILVIGAGVAGLRAAARAREVDPHARIDLLALEPGHPYYRINLTRFLSGDLARAALELAGRAFFDEQGIRLLHGEALNIDRERHEVQLRDGTVLGYDKLVLCTGAHAFRPSIPGIYLPGVFALRSLADADAILKAAGQGARCAVLGGGLLGLEAAWGLARRGVKVTVYEFAPWLLPRQLVEPAASLLERHLRASGVFTVCGARVQELMGDETLRAIRLEGDQEMDVELAIVAMGVRPNLMLPRRAGLETARGLIVDSELRTSDPDIYAAGDIVELHGRMPGLWSVSMAQGEIAGANAAGEHTQIVDLPSSTSLKVLDLEVFTAGQIDATGPGVELHDFREGGVFQRLITQDGVLIGANLVGDASASARVKQCMEAREPIILGREQARELLSRS